MFSNIELDHDSKEWRNHYSVHHLNYLHGTQDPWGPWHLTLKTFTFTVISCKHLLLERVAILRALR